MLPERIETLRQQYTGRRVRSAAGRVELARFSGLLGQVKAVNFNGRALVQFEGPDAAWYDLDLDVLKVIEPAAAKPPEDEPAEELSRLEVARTEKKAREDAEKKEPQ
ncbi:MAG: hypothetical protein HQ567_02230 [Candidatus Nealsonbacteria bacterium]|nr:hypothetical protein [Candidatus Nealsonbacteria bacterium]